jgi:hypothetical protein
MVSGDVRIWRTEGKAGAGDQGKHLTGEEGTQLRLPFVLIAPDYCTAGNQLGSQSLGVPRVKLT